jgi:hypothetical protein
VGGRTRRILAGQLGPQEAAVAQLAGDGQTNRESPIGSICPSRRRPVCATCIRNSASEPALRSIRGAVTPCPGDDAGGGFGGFSGEFG